MHRVLQQYLDNILACTSPPFCRPSNHPRTLFSFVSGEKRRSIRQLLLALDILSLYLPFRSSAFRASVLSQRLLCITKRNTYFVLAHPFALDGTRAAEESPASFFFNWRDALSKDNTTKQFSKVPVTSRSLSRSPV